MIIRKSTVQCSIVVVASYICLHVPGSEIGNAYRCMKCDRMTICGVLYYLARQQLQILEAILLSWCSILRILTPPLISQSCKI